MIILDPTYTADGATPFLGGVTTVGASVGALVGVIIPKAMWIICVGKATAADTFMFAPHLPMQTLEISEILF